jgi:5'-nucleotidase
MKILISNDDGYQSPGLRILAEALAPREVVVVAPDRDRSGASNSLTLTVPLRADRMDNGYYRVEGTPTDCVHLAITGLLDEEPDMVVAGINHGPNLGDDVIYSGTVAAATEGRFLGLPAIAVSIDAFEPQAPGDRGAGHRPAGGEPAHRAPRAEPDPQRQRARPAHRGTPGFAATRLGHRHKAEPVTPATDPRGGPSTGSVPPGPEQDAGPGTDFHALRNGFVSVTPLQVDLTRHACSAPRRVARGLPMMADASSRRVGMTSQRTRERLIQRLRGGGHPRRARCWRPCAGCRATCSWTRPWPAAPTRTRPCPSVTARPSPSPTPWRA